MPDSVGIGVAGSSTLGAVVAAAPLGSAAASASRPVASSGSPSFRSASGKRVRSRFGKTVLLSEESGGVAAHGSYPARPSRREM